MRVGGLVIGGGPFFTSRTEQLGALALRHAVPTVYSYREFAMAGGLLSYGADITDSYRLVGNYIGRILKGDKPATYRSSRPPPKSRCHNLKTAKALGVNIPNTLIGRADEVIE